MKELYNKKNAVTKITAFFYSSPAGNRTRIYGLGNRYSIH